MVRSKTEVGVMDDKYRKYYQDFVMRLDTKYFSGAILVGMHSIKHQLNFVLNLSAISSLDTIII
jgi:hypothetical protein